MFVIVDCSNRGDSLAAVESAVRAREEAIWKREYQRWETERKLWAAREARMLDHIAQLHETLLKLATGNGTTQAGEASSAPRLAIKGDPRDDQLIAPGTPSASEGKRKTDLAEAAQSFQPSSRDDSPLAEVGSLTECCGSLVLFLITSESC